MINRRKITKTIAYAILLCFTSLTGAQPLYAIPANTQLPIGPGGTVGVPQIIEGNVQSAQSGNTLTLTQNGTTSVLKWDNFSIGADASVNFVGPDGKTFSGLNSLNYVAKDGPISEIYGQLTALGGNIFIANPAGVQIGNSAQINVGSLYVTNKDIGDALNGVDENTEYSKIKEAIQAPTVKATNAELMSLGAIVDAKNVTFDGGRIVLDTDRIYQTNDVTGEPTPVKDAALKGILNIRTTDADEVVLGYTAYKNNTYDGQSKEFNLSDGNGTSNVYNGYMWVENLEQLRAMDSNLSGNYALRNSIDANATEGVTFNPIGRSTAFSGNFDGLGYSIFGLNVDVNTNNPAGLFGFTNNAIIRNFTLNGGLINGTKYVGAAVGSASGGTIENITSTATVKGTGGGEGGVGGIVGRAASTAMSGLINIGAVSGTGDSSSNIGGVVGNMSDGTLTGETYNLGHVSGGHEVGGIVGSATYNAKIGNSLAEDPNAFQIYNQLDVEGNYNVGGIVGSISGSSIVTNAANHGTVTAHGSTDSEYLYHMVDSVSLNTLKEHYKGTIAGGNSGREYNKQNDNGFVEMKISVAAANAGGIAGNASGATIENAQNYGDVTSEREKGGSDTPYISGNVGGIVGSAEGMTIRNVENIENNVSGAHNVGGVAGYLGGASTIDGATNNGGIITATGARLADGSGFAQELLARKSGWANSEESNIGNIGGIVGYMYGNDAQVTNSINRGSVHSELFTGNTAPITAQAANAGGIVGKIDSTANDQTKASVYNSFNAGSVQGYMGVGGVIGQMFNGSVARSYNTGSVMTTQQPGSSNSKATVNMGGIVGDTTEAGASAAIYDVYNTGTIGDTDFNFYARHVGGIVGRLSGNIEKAYNTGEIYNGYSTVGGIVGWWYSGNINNVFNTGNITVYNQGDLDNKRGQVGGIAGDISSNLTLSNAYNLGTIRYFALSDVTNNGAAVGGIAGRAQSGTTIKNVYTLGNIYAAKQTGTENDQPVFTEWTDTTVGSIVGDSAATIEYANYIKPEDDSDFSIVAKNNATKTIDYTNRTDSSQYTFEKGIADYGDGTVKGTDADTDRWSLSDDNNDWRIYEGNTPILNAWIPDMQGYLSENHATDSELNKVLKVQYGTAYNPLLTILDVDSDITLNWGALGTRGAGGLAVYGGGLTLNGFSTEASQYFTGTIYSYGDLILNGISGSTINLGATSRLYGSSVTLYAPNSDLSLYGSITATAEDNAENIRIDGKDIEILGSLETAHIGDTFEIDGIKKGVSIDDGIDTSGLNDPSTPMESVSDMYTYTTDKKAQTDGHIAINASGSAEVLYGNMGNGSVTSGGEFSVTGTESVYVDSDISGVGGNISLKSDGEVLLDITNIAAAAATESSNGKDSLIAFLKGYAKGGNKNITLESGNDDEILAVDMWGENSFNLDKFDTENTTFLEAIEGLGEELAGKTHIWISNADQLQSIQQYKNNNEESRILDYNFALKGDINAAAMEDGYEAIGTGSEDGYSGTFDGRGFRIIGLNSGVEDDNTANASEGIFSKLSGTVKDLRVYASKFFGNDSRSTNGNAGAIAAEVMDGAEITGVTTFGNHVEAGANGNAGGIAGTNAGTITDSTASDSVIANNGAAGGVAGINQSTGIIGDKAQEGEEDTFVTSDSAVTSGMGGATALGGIAGDNIGKVYLANSLGVTNGGTNSNVGGIAGKNSGEMHSLYNESIVSGSGNVGGVAGSNDGDMENAVNTTAITADGNYAGGIAGYNGVNASIKSGRNAGAINGANYVGGMVGKNDGIKQAGGEIKGGILTNLSNALVAAITGKEYVGGVAGSNAGEITSDNNLTNEGTVSGAKYVGGIAGENKEGGLIENVISDTLVLKAQEGDAQYFGGIAGTNSGTITDATNKSSVQAKGATYVGGIAGENTATGELTGTLTNIGTVKGKANVGGLAGINKNKNLLIGSEEEHLKVTNTGTVTANEGSAGGIFYENEGEIKYAELTNSGTINGVGQESTGGLFGKNSGTITDSTLTNSGEVTGGDNTGGLIGENTGDITGSKLTNSGTVKGGDNTGGLFGSNTGNATNSSLINEYVAKVTGGENTGGLIGYNTGTITGGRNDADTMYVHKIYNNGAVIGTTNVGGLIGYNVTGGTLENAYNTGLVTADGENAGGIAGTNAGAISSVFNTVMTANGSDAIITGASNVGGIVGNNAAGGTLANAYNTTNVEATGTKGNAVGSNSGKVTNVYATNTNGNLIGDGTGTVETSYSFSTEDEGKENISFIAEDDRNDKDSYESFHDVRDEEGNYVWKFYDGYNTPLLKVFLTKAEYSGTIPTFEYNGKKQGLNAGDIAAADNRVAYNNANSLIQNCQNTNAGDYTLWSDQIAANTTTNEDGTTVFNPNNLGYDMDISYVINKAKLTVSELIAEIVYGGTEYTSIGGGTLDESKIFSQGNDKDDVSLSVNLAEMDKNTLDGYINSDSEYAENKGDRNTADVLRDQDGNVIAYENSLIVTNLELKGKDAENYELTNDEISGAIKVNPAELKVTLDDATHTYGNQAVTNNGGKYVINDEELALVNGDSYSASDFTVTMTDDSALINGEQGGKVTKDAGGEYTWTGTVSGNDDRINKNYEIIVDSTGTSIVEKAKLKITLDTINRDYGNLDKANYNYSFVNGFSLVNGDSRDGLFLSVTYDGAIAEGSPDKPTKTEDVGNYTWSGAVTGNDHINKNYTIDVNGTGTSIVEKTDLYITLDNVERVYGNTTPLEGKGYGFVSKGLTNGDENFTLIFDENYNPAQNDGAVYYDDNGVLKTNDVPQGDDFYKWTVAEEDYGTAFTGVNNLDRNYNITVYAGESKVTPKKLSISSILATIIYGNQDGNGYTVTGGELEGIVYKDDVELAEDFSVENGTFTGTYKENKGDRVTGAVGLYDGGVTYSGLTLTGTKAGNYTIQESVTGRVDVTPAKLTITADDHSMEVGDVPSFTGTTLDELQNMLVNGDRLTEGFAYSFGVEDESIFDAAGTYKDAIGLFYGDTFHDGGLYDKLGGLFANYEVTLTPGTLTVRLPQDDGFIDNYGHLHWLHRGGDRHWNFRERKAEIYFHEGGMDYEENM